MGLIRISCVLILSASVFACSGSKSSNEPPDVPPVEKPLPIANSFAYPIGKTEKVTEAKDKDEWYDAQDFGQNDHLGEDWNKNSGGNTDCGEPVYATANGRVIYAQDAGPGWGNVVIIDHALPSGEKVESLYGHLREILIGKGDVKKRQQIGKVGNANGHYLCHLHFEIRTSDCAMWGQVGPGYSNNRRGWADPSDFIDEQMRKRDK
jgi:murein DD-endopeptidase MepM/ murein hydrolase activator NlpD